MVSIVMISLAVAVSSWERMADTPSAGGYGEAVVGTGDYVYIGRTLYATSIPQFWRYDPLNNTWNSMSISALSNGAFRNGVALAWDQGNYIYALLGARYSDTNRSLFYRYSISENNWEQMEDTPHAQGAGDALIWSGYNNQSSLYALVGSNIHGTNLIYYNISNDSWTTLSFNPNWDFTDDGASLAWTGDEYLYALQGEYIESIPNGNFSRYHIPTNTWEGMTPIPETKGVGDGASLLWIGHWVSEYNDSIFALGGGEADEDPGYNFYIYNTSTNSWTQLESIPGPIGYYNGNRLGFADNSIYYWQGSPTTERWITGGKAFYKYLLGTNVSVETLGIPLTQGWNLISIPLILENNSLNYLFKNTNTTIFSYKNNSWFVPNEIDNKLGYWLKINQSLNLTLIGTEIEDKTIELNNGWNLIGYPYLIELRINESDLKNYTTLTYINSSWSSYIPSRTTNSLTALKLGYGYWVKK